MNKKDIIRLLENIAVYMELKGENPFKISAYRKAAQAIETDDRSLNEIDDFTKMKGIGKGTAAVITEFIEAGHSETLAELEKEVPAGLVPLLDLPGLGGKKLSKLYQELGVIDAETLKEACLSGKVEELPGFGKKSVEKIVAAIEDAGKRPERLPVAMMLPIAEKIEAYLEDIPGIVRYSQAGSIRRMRETVKDLDFIIATDDAGEVKEALIALPSVKNVIASGDTKVSITLEEAYDINVDFRMVSDGEFASTLHHFTGSKDHNVAMRQLAKSRGEKISEYGVEVEETGETLQFETEEAFFNHFDLHFIPPEVRENTGEVDLFTEEQKLIRLSDIRGDLHMHTTWSDGAQSLDEMAEKVKSMGYSYMAITDHSKYLRVANGLNEERLRKQRQEINALNEKYADFHIFSGVEMDILPDGSLDFEDDFLKEMDFVIGAIHSSFQQSEEEIMHRLTNALENPYVSIIAHPTGRLIGRRDGYKVNLEKLIEKAKETNTALEINANPNRLDLSHEWAKKAQEAGVNLVIDTDAHNYQMLEHMQYGVATARKGWIKPSTVINTWTKEELAAFFNQGK
ncbi:DNA polymerase/3'-5' exonuclease PolX [Oceanobacillus oncorhynchi subsp. incaldanensis]|uniref:DNA-directed DNA polymerase n=1 Tax=Oceanobacillus oncorhynchi TaxID=545501 RepID=A0A0A1MEY8_9BACI|nr:DNA polymerase/3'-5' exonuclease PolX [Oceanobacillus oncorhynchi]GIO17001.1 DNA polymerase/3'-5' exonuclease PolX [Oceanobacillus oncorhynchi subsp. incaldanensis]CEI83945.1 DNA polymerase/3'-5' exonuclease PolX [Oceanobacillus oncorhynchi]